MQEFEEKRKARQRDRKEGRKAGEVVEAYASYERSYWKWRLTRVERGYDVVTAKNESMAIIAPLSPPNIDI